MAVISDYNSLVAEVKAWCARSDSAFSARFPVFVAAAEERLYNGHGEPGETLYTPPIRSRVMESDDTTVTLTDGVGELPDDALAIKKISRAGDTTGLTYAPPHTWDAYQAGVQNGGPPSYYKIEGLTISVAPVWSGDLVIRYYKRLPAISSENTTGDMLTAHGLAYFSAVMFEAFSFMQEPELAVAYLGKLKSVIDGINRVAHDVRTGGARVRSISQVLGV